MSKILQNLKTFQKAKIIFTQARNFKFAEVAQESSEPRKKIGPFGWFLLVCKHSRTCLPIFPTIYYSLFLVQHLVLVLGRCDERDGKKI